MNFKVDWIKVFSSIALGVILGLFYSNSREVFDGGGGFLNDFIPAFLLAFAAAYIGWSAFDK